MMHNREFKQFTVGYGILAAILWVALLTGNWIYWEKVDYGNRDFVIGQSLYLGITVLVLELLLYGMAFFFFRKVYRKISDISEQMSGCITRDVTVVEGEYSDGELGILKSNFHKMVRAMKEAKEQEKKEKIFLKDIISDISHQLKTPLASLTVFMDLLAEDRLSDSADRQRIIEESKNQLSRMEWMVLSLLKLARIEAGAITFECREIPLRPLLMESIECLRVRWEQKQQTITLECDENLCHCLDREWLQEALVNIIKNAIDYTPQKGQIQVKVEQTKVFTRIIVEDDGIGIAPEDITHIFERFRRGNNNVNSNSVGIGLSLAKSIVEGQQGKIHVDSEQGKYTRFTLTFLR